MVTSQMAQRSDDVAKAKTEQLINGGTSTAALYGMDGDVEALVRQSGYSADSGKQFAWSANAQFTPAATSYSATDRVEQIHDARMAELHTQILNPVERGVPNFLVTGVATPEEAARWADAPPMGTVSNLSGWDSFRAFNPVGQFLNGAYDRGAAMVSGAWNVAMHPVDTATGIYDHYANAYSAGHLSDTILSDAGNVATGLVKETFGTIDALYRRDEGGGMYRFGGSVTDAAAMFAGPEFAGSAVALGGRAVEGSVAIFGPKLAGMTESHLAKTGGLSYAIENTGVSTIGEVGAGTRQGGYVFRGDGRAPDLIFQEGFQDEKDTDSHITPEVIEAARKNPSGWVYKIEGEFGPDDYVPPENVVGAWKVDEHGQITGEFMKNPKYQVGTSKKES